MKYSEIFFEIDDLISGDTSEAVGVREQYFITGPHASGKSAIAKIVWKDNNTLFFDTGPILRGYRDSDSPGMALDAWLEEYEERYGMEFTDKLLASHIYRNAQQNSYATTIVIVGNRSLQGVRYLQKKIKVPYSKLIYITAPLSILYERYKMREGKQDLLEKEFKDLLDLDRERGLEKIRSSANFLLSNTRSLDEAAKHLLRYIEHDEEK